MNLIELSLRRDVFAWILMSALIVFGAICLNRMGVSQMPDVDFPVLNITVNYDGASPEVIESEILDPVEQRLLVIEGIKEMRSSARQGSGSVTIELDINRNVDVALQEVQSALSQWKPPTGVDPAVVKKTNPEEDPIMIISVYGDKPIRDLLRWCNNYLLDQIQFLPGVGEVSVGGFSEPNLRVWLDPEKLKKADLTVRDVQDALSTQHLEKAAGQIVVGDRELRVRFLGEGMTPQEVEDIKIVRRAGQLIQERTYKIKDVATVIDDLSDIRRQAWVKGQTAVGIQIRKQRGTNEVDVAEAVRNKLEAIKGQFPEGLKYRTTIDFTRSTKATVDLTKEKLWVAALVTIFVCFLFLGSLQAAVNILFSIPTSIIGTFIILYFSKFTLNLFTLLALTLAVSIVVDDAIMLLENIVRHFHMKKSAFQAAYDGAMEILPAATASTFAVVAVFMPVIFMSGVIGKFFFQFGVTMSAAVLLSLLEAVTITPMRAAALMGGKSAPSRFETWLDHKFHNLSQMYARFLKIPLGSPFLVVALTLGVFVGSLILVKKVRQEFVPSQDQDIIIVSAQTPAGSSLDFTVQAGKKLDEILLNDKNVAGFLVSAGAGGPSASVNQIFIPVTLLPRAERSMNHTAIMQELREKFKSVKEARVSMRDISARNLATGRLNPIAFNVRGPDLEQLDLLVHKIMERLEKEGLGVDMDTDFRLGNPEVEVVPDRNAMAAHTVTIDAVAETLSVAIAGIKQGRFTSEGKREDIRIKVTDQNLSSMESINLLSVENSYGNLIPLSQLVTLKEVKALSTISRINRQRAISVYGNLAPGKSQTAVLDRAREIAKEVLPAGYTFNLEGASAGFSEAFGSLNFALLIGVLMAYMILAIQFNSFVHPIVVLVALPFSVTGALFALWVTDTSLNMFSFIGLIVLMGIAKKNSIMLVEFTNQVRHKNSGDSKNALHDRAHIQSALIEACPVRLRPVLMTSVATVAAALPLMIGKGIGYETRLPMGLTIVGGTIVSTAMTLLVVPALYVLLSRFERNRTNH